MAKSKDFVYIITGQSNATGSGNPSTLTAQDKAVPKYIRYCANAFQKEFTRMGTLEIGYGIEIQLKNRLMADLNKIPGFDRRRDNIVIVKSSLAKPIHEWKRFGPEYARLMETLLKCGLNRPVYMGMFLIQGEANRVHLTLANGWADDAASAITDIRNALNAPTMPVIYTRIGLDIYPANLIIELRHSQDRLPSLVDRVAPVETSYLEKLPEPGISLHYKYPQQLADLMYDEFMKMPVLGS